MSALHFTQARKLLDGPRMQLRLLDKVNLIEIECEDYLGKRIVGCHNPVLLERSRHEHEMLLHIAMKTEHPSFQSHVLDLPGLK